jgi:hypothetical protein
MKRRTATVIALCSTLLAATAAFAPTVRAGNVAWGVSVGGPGFSVVAGQPGWSGGRAWFGPPLRPLAPVAYRPWLRPVPVVAPISFAPFALAPAPFVVPRVVPRRVIVVRQPVRFAAPAFVQLR